MENEEENFNSIKSTVYMYEHTQTYRLYNMVHISGYINEIYNNN